jgi:DNA (cytosine-5)-methyltransferase 1
MNVGSLFSGIGGIELGLERAGGFKTAWFVEWDPYAQQVLKKHWPSANVYGDISKIDWSTMPPVDVLTGGFPCQDASIANASGEGIKGARTGLWKHYLEGIRVLRPKFVIAENVPNLINRGFEEVIEDLAKIGYVAEWDTLRYVIIIERDGETLFMERERLVTIAYPVSELVEGICEKRSDVAIKESLTLAKELLVRREYSLPEPCLHGVGTRIPNRTHRIRCVGNAVSPRMSEAIATAIKRSVNL